MFRLAILSRFIPLAALCAMLVAGPQAQAALPVVGISNNATLTFLYATGAAAPPAQTLTVTSDQPVTVTGATTTYPGQPAASWLTIFPPNSSLSLGTPATLTFFASPAGLATGSYAAQVVLTVSTAVDPTSILSITVFLTVNGSSGGGGTNFNETMSVSPASLSFAFQPGGAVPIPQALAVTTSDNASVTTSVTTNDGNAWLLVSPSTVVTPGTINVSVNPATLAGGTYNGNITITAPNTVTQVPVTLTVGSVGLSVTPTSMAFNEPQNFGLSAYQPMTISAITPLPVSISAASDVGSWLQVDNNSSTTPATIGVRANDSSLPQGTYAGTITVQAGPSNSVTIPVSLNVGIPAPVSLQPSSLNFTWQINDPLPAVQSAKVNSLTGSAVPFTIASSTNDGATWLVAVAAPATTPGSLSVTVNPSTLSVGTYSGTINVTPTIANASPQPIVVTLTVKPAPVPTLKSVTNSASYATGSVAPGELVTIFGSGIGPATLTTPPAGTAPQSLGNTSVTFDGIPAPIYYVSAGQTSVQVPYNIGASQTVLKLTYNGITSAGTTLPRLAASPGLFTSDSTGQRQLAALNADLSVNSASNPAVRGAALVLYGTGEGQTVPASVEGARVPIIVPFPQTQFTVLVTIGGQAATVQYAGETPGLLSGLLQINVTVPAGAPTGSNVPVQVVINGQPTQANVTVAIK